MGRKTGLKEKKKKKRKKKKLKLNFNDVDYNVSTQSEVTDYFMKKDLSKP